MEEGDVLDRGRKEGRKGEGNGRNNVRGGKREVRIGEEKEEDILEGKSKGRRKTEKEGRKE